MTLDDLEKRRAALVAYSDAQRTMISEGVAELKRPLGGGFLGLLQSHPSAVLMSGGGVLLGTYLAKKLAKFSSGLWLGKKILSLFGGNGVFR